MISIIFAVNLGPSIVTNLPQSTCHYSQFITHVKQTFFCTPLTMPELRNIVFSLPTKSSSGFDGLSTKNFKKIFALISTPLQIINKSFDVGIFLDILKIAKVVSVFKGGLTEHLIKYRPISILPTLSKIF